MLLMSIDRMVGLDLSYEMLEVVFSRAAGIYCLELVYTVKQWSYLKVACCLAEKGSICT